MNIAIQIVLVLILSIASLALYYGFKTFVLDKFRIKKRYLLIAFIVILIMPFILMLLTQKILPGWANSVQMLLLIIVFLSYLDARRMERMEKSKPVIGRPKPKPNRLKNK